MIRVLIVDDSRLVRKLFRDGLGSDPEIEVVGEAPDPYRARDLILRYKPDVMTLDIEMPRMDGLTFLGKLMKHYPMPVVICSSGAHDGSEKAMAALSLGAVEVMSKSQEAGPAMVNELIRKVKAAAASRLEQRPPVVAGAPTPSRCLVAPRGVPTRGVIAVGASTGGPAALSRLLAPLPAETPGIVIVQHMPPLFTASLAARLDRLGALRVREARDGDAVVPGLALVAPGDRHLLLMGRPGRYRVELRDGPRVGPHKPAVEVLFRSVAKAAGADAVGVIMTGMGGDGARGLLAMHQAGAWTIAQDEPSCVVYGMPREAVLQGGVDEEVALDDIPACLLRAVAKRPSVNAF
ncbi:MAG TPA: chemotaxis response regulator protein-glutamate methylesterase [Candidatus Krumholzibacteria bacterium]|nr:chemotaxis response regulator protein-glutamate methylesterase [Candidatus Krumholzibacteria bacterium]HPD70436.1 chemotaxis response regulator protein-glutamate methylesterase [Candidatus Krumholzibacteria bacterium]HRY39864.1 chemotaxis response regulator protein-glutamate methylesterase [Candidatus Krumholzibacteria bacterium]